MRSAFLFRPSKSPSCFGHLSLTVRPDEYELPKQCAKVRLEVIAAELILTFQPSVLFEARQLPLELDAGGEGLEGLELREGARHRLLGGEDGRDGQGPPGDGLGTARLGHDGERVLPEGAQPPDGDGVGVRRVLDEDVRLPAECHNKIPVFQLVVLCAHQFVSCT